MSDFEIPTGERLERARRRFDAALRVAELTAAAEAGGAGGRMPISRLHARAAGLDARPDPELDRALAAQPRLRAVYRRMLERAAVYYLPRQAAASTGRDAPRSGENCVIRFQRSRAEPTQYYVIVELVGTPETAPKALVVCDADNRCWEVPLPPARDGLAQLILDEQSDLLQRLFDPESEVFLR